jgi:sortase A
MVIEVTDSTGENADVVAAGPDAPGVTEPATRTPIDAPAAEDAPPADGRDRRPNRRRTGAPAPTPVSILLALVMMASVAAAFFGAFAFGLSGLQEQRSQHELYATLRGLLDPASPVAPYLGGSKVPAGAPLALLSAPRAGLRDTVVVEGTSSGDLLAGPGHLIDSPLPGQAGNSVILGKAATAGAPFAHVPDLQTGDVITVRTGQGLFHYTVRGHLVDGGRLPTVPSTSGFLVLGTSAGSGSLASLSPDRVVYVYARLQGKAVPAPHGRPHTVATTAPAGQSDTAAWPLLALWAAVLLAATAACWWLWSTWGLLRTWIVGAPILFAILWALSNEALRLLPNVY